MLFYNDKNISHLCISFTILCHDMACNFNDILWDFNAMRFVCYAMINWNEGLNDMVCMLWNDIRFEEKCVYTQTSSKHFEIK